MKDRCSNPHRKDWYRYGAVGITVCDTWRQSFEAFVSDMGEAPIGKSIDRIDCHKGYNKENCRWATTKEQALNTQRTVAYIMDGHIDSIPGWMDTLKMSRWHTIKYLEAYAEKRPKIKALWE